MHLPRSASDKVYQLLAHGRWFSPGTPASSTTKTGRHGIAEILLSEAQHKNIKINQSIIFMKHSWTDSFNVSFNVFLTGHYCKCLGVC